MAAQGAGACVRAGVVAMTVLPVFLLALAARADAIAPYLQGLPGSGSDAPAAAGVVSGGRPSHARSAVVPAREGGATAGGRAGTAGWVGSAAAGRGAAADNHGRLGIPTPNTDNFGGPGRE